jgi:hypothetical protein
MKIKISLTVTGPVNLESLRAAILKDLGKVQSFKATTIDGEKTTTLCLPKPAFFSPTEKKSAK